MKRNSVIGTKQLDENPGSQGSVPQKNPEVDVITFVEVFEYERFVDDNWDHSNLVCFGKHKDPKRFKWDAGEADAFPESSVPKEIKPSAIGWVYKGDSWEINIENSDDSDGWVYASTIKELETENIKRVIDPDFQYIVRRRKWTRSIISEGGWRRAVSLTSDDAAGDLIGLKDTKKEQRDNKFKINSKSNADDGDSNSDKEEFDKSTMNSALLSQFYGVSIKEVDDESRNGGGVSAFENQYSVKKQFKITIVKGKNGIGLDLKYQEGVGTYVEHVKILPGGEPNPSASAVPPVEVNDVIISVNGKTAVGVSMGQVIETIKDASGSIELTVERGWRPSKESVNRKDSAEIEEYSPAKVTKNGKDENSGGGGAKSQRRASLNIGGFNLFQQSATQQSTHQNKSQTGAIDLRQRDPGVFDSIIVNIGKQLKVMETQCVAKDEAKMKDWSSKKKPVLEKQISELEKHINIYKKKFEVKTEQPSYDRDEKLEELKILTNAVETCKKNYYLPNSAIVVGADGVYVGIDDFWLESATGSFNLELAMRSSKTPIISCTLGGKDNPDDGVNISLEIENFTIIGEKGKGVPKLTFDSIKVSISVKISLGLSYDVNSSKWATIPEQFSVDILAFKGPYGLSKGIINLILGIAMPTIQQKLAEVFPPELGLLIKTLPSPVEARGIFDLNGIELDVLDSPLEKCPLAKELINYEAHHIDIFGFMQKSLGRSAIMKSLSDLIRYYRKFSKHVDDWKTMIVLWNQACRVYCERYFEAIESNLDPRAADPDKFNITFDSFLQMVDDVRKKRISFTFKLSTLECHFSLNNVITYLHILIDRITNENLLKSSGVEYARLLILLDQIRADHELAKNIVKEIAKAIDFVQLKLDLSLSAGPEGVLSLNVSDLLSQTPLLINLILRAQKSIGHDLLVPAIFSFKPQENGDFYLELYHLSKEGMESSRPGEYKVKGLVTQSHRRLPSSNGLKGGLDETVKKEVSNEGAEEKSKQHFKEADSKTPQSPSSSSSNSNFVKDEFNTNDLKNSEKSNLSTNEPPPLVKSKSMITASANSSSSNSNPFTKMSSFFNSSTSSVSPDKTATRAPGSPTSTESSPSRPVAEAAQRAVVSKENSDSNLKSKQRNAKGESTHSISSNRSDLDIKKSPDLKLKSVKSLREELDKTLSSKPVGDIADTMLVVVVTKPHISFISDRVVTLKEGSELFSIKLGLLDPKWKPFAYPPNEHLNISKDSLDVSEAKPGLPILIQSSLGIKNLAEIPKIKVSVNLPAIVRFILSHFENLPDLQLYLQSLLGADLEIDQLEATKLIIDKITKYFLMPGLNLFVNTTCKLVSSNNDIIVTVLTKSSVPDINGGDDDHTKSENDFAVRLSAELALLDIFEDGLAIDKSIKDNFVAGK